MSRSLPLLGALAIVGLILPDGTASARPLPLPVSSVGPARADALVVGTDGSPPAGSGVSGLLTWRVDGVLFASRFRPSAEGFVLTDPGGFVLGPGGSEFSSQLAASDLGFVLVSAGPDGVFLTRVLDLGEAGVELADPETLWSGPAQHARVACRGELCVAAWVAVMPGAEVLYTVSMSAHSAPRPGAATPQALAVAAPLSGRAIAHVALAESVSDTLRWLVAWSQDDGAHVMPLDAAGGPAGSKTLVPGRNPSLIALPEPASWLVMTEVEDGVFRVRTHGEGDDDSDSEGWALPGEARIGVQLCHGGDGLRLTWRGAGGTGFVQRLSLAGAPLDTPIALPHTVTALACASGVALGLVQSGATVELQDLDAPIETALVPVKTAVAPLDSLALLGTQDTLATSPWLVVGRQGGTAFAVEVSAELGHKTQVFSEEASSIRAAYHGAEGASPVEGVQAAWRVAWQVGPAGRSVETSVREASGWSAPTLLLEDPALVEFVLGRDLIAWTTPSGATLARVRVGQALEPIELIGPQSLPQAGSGTAIGSLHCSADHCVRLRRSGSQFVVQPIRLDEDGPLLSPERVISSDVDTYDAALRGDSVLVAHVRYGELLEVRLSATGVRLGGQSFGLGESITAAPTASGWLIAAVQDGRLFGAAVSELGASHSPRDLFWAEPEAYRVEQSHPQLASAGPDSQTLLLHQRGPVGAFQSRRPALVLVAGPAPLGAPCTLETACQSGFCVDGVCCEDACFGGRPDCFACAGHTLTDGLCGLIAEGSPCSEVDTVCDPIDRCDAEGACLKTVAPEGTPCGDRGVTCRVDDRCDGLGVCLDQGLQDAGATCGLPDPCGELGACAVSGLCVREPCELCPPGGEADPAEPANGDCPPPPGCGNGVLDPGEECDAGENNAALGNHCRPTCRLPACGDGLVDQAEQCDLGADNGGELCTSDCARVLGPVTVDGDGDGCSGAGLSLGLWALLSLVLRRASRRSVRLPANLLTFGALALSACGDTASEVARDCEVDRGGCSEHARCTTEPAGVTCVCEAGFVGDGLTCEPVAPPCEAGFRLSPSSPPTCVDLDECLAGLDDCEQRCVNTEGAFRCECFDGYLDEGEGCTNLDECALGLDDCAFGSTTCIDTDGGYTCRCAPGFEPASPTGLASSAPLCIDIDECAGEHGCVSGCVNTVGAYRCTCEDGYALASDGVSCEDYDECADSNPCDGTCTNTVGGYTCGCPDGARLEPTGHCTTSSLEVSGAVSGAPPLTFVVPDGVTALVIEAWGGQGGLSTGGRGGYVYTRLTVEPGLVLHIAAGRQGSGEGATVGGGIAGTTPNSAGRGGGGGGASDIRLGGDGLFDRVVVAGGGGGGGRGIGATANAVAFGGLGGGLVGGDGSGQSGFHGAGGTQLEGGLGASLPPADTGSFGLGGTSMSGAPASGGGGGGGYFGGGAGESGFAGGAGGGGSSFVTPDAVYIHHEQGVRGGHGAVILRW